MRDLRAGLYIKSTAALIGSFFEHTTILLVEHNEEGSLGFVTNKSFEKSLHELIEFTHSKPFPLMDGGPVEREHLFVLHKRPDLIDGGKQIPKKFNFLSAIADGMWENWKRSWKREAGQLVIKKNRLKDLFF
jgi:putative AlgH/UPF0301 family transcriptional regulator